MSSVRAEVDEASRGGRTPPGGGSSIPERKRRGECMTSALRMQLRGPGTEDEVKGGALCGRLALLRDASAHQSRRPSPFHWGPVVCTPGVYVAERLSRWHSQVADRGRADALGRAGALSLAGPGSRVLSSLRGWRPPLGSLVLSVPALRSRRAKPTPFWPPGPICPLFDHSSYGGQHNP
jgi:hypothetical protein